MKRLNFALVTSGAALMFYSFWGVWAGHTTWSPINFVLIAILIGSVGYSNVQRTDLLQ